MMEFEEFPKIARLNREVVVTEKIDGTNAQVHIVELPDDQIMPTDTPILATLGSLLIYAGSRNRFVTPEKDNFGFARWVKEHAEELARLGPGTHYGEWWGSGVQRGYGLINGEKRFSLFNVGRWYDVHGTNDSPAKVEAADRDPDDARCAVPACCYVVPVLAHLPNLEGVNGVLADLKANGSCAAPGFMKPEGVVAFHSASRALFKATVEKDEKPKGVA